MRYSPSEANVLWQVDYNNQMLMSNFSCASVAFVSGLPLQISPEYLNYTQCSCLRGFFGIPPKSCLPCPEGCHCFEGGQVLKWKKGYYPVFIGKDMNQKKEKSITL